MNGSLAATVLFALTLLTAGCAGPRSYVVLLPSPDGSIGKVLVSTQANQQLLTEARTGALLDASAPAFPVSLKQLTRDFGAAMSALPALPEQYYLYFLSGSSQLTSASSILLVQILQRINGQATLDMSVIGHTDTLGNVEVNDRLALDRANQIADQLRQAGVPSAFITVASHGKRNLLIETPDQTTESRNRRVEITIR
ncbi:MAG: Type secretion outer membrane protein TolC [Polaromonas sp.]|nr:Type secretion outer membrane protein TolC [Polaromonas sp.]